MKFTQNRLQFNSSDILLNDTFTTESIFFDIETTGFSPSRTQLYLIGCATRDNDEILIQQFFAETMLEEKEILEHFLNLLQNYSTIITYNGIGFDIPYLKAKCKQFSLADPFDNFTYTDIYKSVCSYKHIFNFENYKQKSIEFFLQIDREDKYSGGELIPVYHDYLKNQDTSLYSLLMLHNYEDVLGMIDLVPILSYERLFQGRLSISSVKINDCLRFNGDELQELIVTLAPAYPIARPISFHFDDIYLSIRSDVVNLVLPIVTDSLKYFYPNYKDYYYLLDEDTAMHKSVASYVEKSHRVPCKASTCYTKKSGRFLPQFQPDFITPAFYCNYGDKLSYFEYRDGMFDDQDLCLRYVKHILMNLADRKQLANYMR